MHLVAPPPSPATPGASPAPSGTTRTTGRRDIRDDALKRPQEPERPVENKGSQSPALTLALPRRSLRFGPGRCWLLEAWVGGLERMGALCSC